MKVLVTEPHCSFVSKMSDPNFLFEINDVVMKKKILSVREHYDFEDLKGAPLGSAEANFLQIPPKFVLVDNHGSELMRLEGKMVSLRNEFAILDNQGPGEGPAGGAGLPRRRRYSPGPRAAARKWPGEWWIFPRRWHR